MPWCPVCKNEYKEGYTHCNDCDVDLVVSLEEGPVAVIFGEKEPVHAMADFLHANGVEDAFVRGDEKEIDFELYVPREMESQAKSLLNVYIKDIARKEQAETLGVSEEELSQMEQEGFDSESVDEDGVNVLEKVEKAAKEAAKEQTAYEDKRQKAEDYKSSAFALIVVGAVGIVLLILLLFDVLPIHLGGSTKYMTSGVMGLMFLVFLVLGVSSYKMYKKYLIIADEEENLITQMKDFLSENASREQVETNLMGGAGEQADDTQGQAQQEDMAQMYYKRIEIIKSTLSAHFPQAQDSLVEKLADDWYGEQFEEVDADSEFE